MRYHLLIGAPLIFYFMACSPISKTEDIVVGTVKTTYYVTKGTLKIALGAGTGVYKIGAFTFKVAMAPISWPLTREEIKTMDGLPPKKAIMRGKVKKAPYVVRGKRYVPMSEQAARSYREKGIASWYGYETWRQKGGRMTANGEAFNPQRLSAVHKLLPLPSHVRVTNLENRRSIIVRVNDRGPFMQNPFLGKCERQSII